MLVSLCYLSCTVFLLSSILRGCTHPFVYLWKVRHLTTDIQDKDQARGGDFISNITFGT